MCSLVRTDPYVQIRVDRPVRTDSCVQTRTYRLVRTSFSYRLGAIFMFLSIKRKSNSGVSVLKAGRGLGEAGHQGQRLVPGLGASWAKAGQELGEGWAGLGLGMGWAGLGEGWAWTGQGFRGLGEGWAWAKAGRDLVGRKLGEGGRGLGEGWARGCTRVNRG